MHSASFMCTDVFQSIAVRGEGDKENLSNILTVLKAQVVVVGFAEGLWYNRNSDLNLPPADFLYVTLTVWVARCTLTKAATAESFKLVNFGYFGAWQVGT